MWIDKEGIAAGDDWGSQVKARAILVIGIEIEIEIEFILVWFGTQISEALYGCRAAIIFLSEPFFESINCTKEIKMFARRVERKEVGTDKNTLPPKGADGYYFQEIQLSRSGREGGGEVGKGGCFRCVVCSMSVLHSIGVVVLVLF